MSVDLYLHFSVDEESGARPDYLFYDLPPGTVGGRYVTERIVLADNYTPISFPGEGENLLIIDAQSLAALVSLPVSPLLFILTGDGYWYILSVREGTLSLVIGEDPKYLASGIAFYEIFNLYPQRVDTGDLEELDYLLLDLRRNHQGLAQLEQRSVTLLEGSLEEEDTFGLSQRLATMVDASEQYLQSL